MTSSELRSLVYTGGSVIIDAKEFDASSLQAIAFTARTRGAKVIIKNASLLTINQCKNIAFSGGSQGNVIFDFTE